MPSPVNLVTEKDGEGRVFVSTYPTMMGLIDETKDGQRRFGVGHFDLSSSMKRTGRCTRSIGAIFDYFDSLLVGLTATPKDEIDINTYGLFDLERGVPTDAYGLDDAVKDGFLVPAKAVSVPLKFQREGINYDDCPRRRRSSGTRSNGTKTASRRTASRPRRSTSGCSTRTPWTRCSST